MRFQDKCVLVTGAAANTGYGIAQRFAVEGARVWLNDLEPAATAAAAARIQAATGARVVAVPADLSDPVAIARMFAAIQADGGRLDVLVNNAVQQAIGHSFVTTPLDVLEYTIRVNLIGLFHCGQQAARLMLVRHTGVIVNLGSNSAERAIRNRSAYIATKGAVEALTRAMAIELGPHGIRVNTVVPGYIFTRRWEGLDPAVITRRRANVPLGREAAADDVAGAVLYLASDEARRVTGARLVVDGGCSIQLVPEDLETL
jgi:NAD(P)-dependent dehydrogenase (short-subunit alcohol dehydrogenase family)